MTLNAGWHKVFFDVGDSQRLRSRRESDEGTSSLGKRRNKTHTLCRRCGAKALQLQKSTCGNCAYSAKRQRKYYRSVKAKRRNTTGLYHTRHLKVFRRFRNGFCEGTTPNPRHASSSTA
ncbi:60S ribosomal protein L37-like [Pristis pectinata]|uniref:60S ribosomal protein L37-like n=1 Tax=Pristis pectinata TaxID=685728 RepID=UPI00223DAB13|nr:60S ribosomal protein L37-like [Pristis pectinata]